MLRSKILNLMSKKESFTREDLKEAIQMNDPNYNLENISSLLESYIKKGLVKKIGLNQYSVITDKKGYVYTMSKELQEIHDYLLKEYSNIRFQVWEFSQLNEFLNHLLATTTYVVEVEDMFTESFFEILKEKFNHVLLKPTCDEFFRYAKNGTILVKKLVSESPNDIDTPHQVRLEKILVDVVADKFTSGLINKSEVLGVYQYSFNRYIIDERKMLRYARRRNAQMSITGVLKDAKE